ncbi:monovalent cation/H(+) antiporter subunit G [Nocardiopsis alba]|uniref:Na+/H+ antiporter subunit G n=1 Tax=Nocardiopsis alba TaxID=53437 RepID=A0A7K2ITM3_9ACTN|nr:MULTISPECIES: monovalent cation/H(+) antiporter subunit G [Nocardiopsis]MEC3893732.1 monovalent cation/H(+) antiporter subunit G [Nocardiopsis sp. LDBS1602]MYR33318.1 Na+/H+ antiporter subunit G [Nocardiopsis alba]
MSDQLVTVLDWAAILCLLAGSLLSFVAAVGLMRFPDLLSRMHTAAKPQILGMLLVLVGIGLRMLPVEETGVFDFGTLILVGLFQVVTVPVAGHIAARVGYRTGRIRRDLVVTDELAERLDSKRRANEGSEAGPAQG